MINNAHKIRLSETSEKKPLTKLNIPSKSRLYIFPLLIHMLFSLKTVFPNQLPAFDDAHSEQQTFVQGKT